MRGYRRFPGFGNFILYIWHLKTHLSGFLPQAKKLRCQPSLTLRRISTRSSLNCFLDVTCVQPARIFTSRWTQCLPRTNTSTRLTRWMVCQISEHRCRSQSTLLLSITSWMLSMAQIHPQCLILGRNMLALHGFSSRLGSSCERVHFFPTPLKLLLSAPLTTPNSP